ncbi:MAG TPA: response regulator, partial [Bacteroidia bacterium]|nr:response regulator [Bacteroidia bacterium]
TYIEAQQGVIYLVNDQFENDTYIEPVSFFAPGREILSINRIELSEGLVGQVITSNKKIYLQSVNDNSSSLDTGISKISVCDIFIMPLFAGGRVVGAVEIKSVHAISIQKREFIERIAEPVASNILNLKANLLTRRLLEESQLKTRELAQQDEDLRQINNELVIQSGRLKQSESELIKQQEILQRVNSELENKALLLEEKNMAIEDAHKALAFKAEQLERSSKYKSDFLANMSHELRTPLNSVLILAKLLGENKAGNMTAKQVEHAKVIHKSGSDLLVIINDILDLSKIEAGKLELIKEKTAIFEICNNMEQLYKEVSRDKNISFSTYISTELPEFMNTDRVRIEQVLKNLLSNAFKFTEPDGFVKLEATLAPKDKNYQNEKLKNAREVICFAVSDSGIGIPEGKQKLIFEAFSQADSSTTRKYGGTGLGLTICRQLTSLLGGDILVESLDGKGSVFKLFLPITDVHKLITNVSSQKSVTDADISKSNNHDYAGEILLFSKEELEGREWMQLFEFENYHVSMLTNFEFENIAVSPDIVIIDATLSDKEYVQTVFDLKKHPKTRKAAIVCRSVSEYVPTEIADKILLHTTSQVNSKIVSEILHTLHTSEIMNVGAGFSDASFAGLSSLQKEDEIRPATGKNRLEGEIILIADDDIRNIYSMTTIFENEGAEVICAMDGFEVLEKFKENENISIVLMDIMMPNMDGLQAIKELRNKPSSQNIPIIAVTAKAMRGDREICLSAGANDYITKPVNVELLLTQVFNLLKIH